MKIINEGRQNLNTKANYENIARAGCICNSGSASTRGTGTSCRSNCQAGNRDNAVANFDKAFYN